MTEKEFIVWLHGFLEISEAKALNEKQVAIIKDHLSLFFQKVTPDRSEPPSTEELRSDYWKKMCEEISKELDKERGQNSKNYPWNFPQYPIQPYNPIIEPPPAKDNKITCTNDPVYLDQTFCKHPPNKTYC
jgi:hypothetical protein